MRSVTLQQYDNITVTYVKTISCDNY